MRADVRLTPGRLQPRPEQRRPRAERGPGREEHEQDVQHPDRGVESANRGELLPEHASHRGEIVGGKREHVIRADVVATGLTAGDVLRVSVFSVYDEAEETGAFWDMPSTAPEDRELAVTYSGTGP